MYKDVARRILASILTICMIGSTPGMSLLAAEGGNTESTYTHTYPVSMGEAITPCVNLGESGSIENTYTVQECTDPDNNAQKITKVSFALDRSQKLDNNTTWVKTADYKIVLTADGQTYEQEGTYDATDSALFEDDIYCIVNLDAANQPTVGVGDTFSVKVELSNAERGNDSNETLTDTDIYYQKAKNTDNSVSSSVTSGTSATTQLSGEMACIRATGVETRIETPVTGIAIADGNFSMEKGTDKQLTVNYTPGNTTEKGVTWKSSNEAVATVDANGNVHAVEQGKATITATSTADDDLTSSITITVCKGITDSDISISTIAPQTYTGQQLQPTLEVKDGDTVLKKGTHYTLNYGDANANIAAGTGKVTIEGTGTGYIGSTVQEFTIEPVDLGTNGGIEVSCDSEYDYDPDTIADGIELEDPASEITLTYAYTTDATPVSLVYNKDYEIVGYQNNTVAGNRAYAILQGIGNYKGTINCYFKIKKSIQATSVTAEISPSSNTYTGSKLVPTITVKDGENVLGEGTDYEVKVKDASDNETDWIKAEAKTVEIIGKGAYVSRDEQGNDIPRTLNYTINQRDLDDVTIEEIPNQSEADVTSQNVKGLELSYGNYTLVEGTDYTVTVAENAEDATKADITITGTGNFTGTIEEQVSIGKDLSDATKCTITVESVTYTGEALKPGITVTYDGEELTKGTDYYIVGYKNNKNACEDTDSDAAYVEIAGIGDYAGTVKQYFAISKKKLSDFTKANWQYDSTVPYQKGESEIQSDLTLTYNGKTLIEGTDYTVTYSDCGEVTKKATMTVNAVADGNFEGTFDLTYQITAPNIADMTFEPEVLSDEEYTGSKITKEIVISQNGTTLEKDTDYTLDYSGNTDIGTATVAVTGIGNYTGYKELTFKIGRVGIENAEVTLNAEWDFTGKEIKPVPTVVVDGNTLTYKTDFTMDYVDNVEAGEATITLTGVGNYSESKTVTFKIIKKLTDDTIEVETIPTQYYAGVEVEPEVTVTDSLQNGDTRTLVKDTDYTLEYKDNDADGTATVTIQGMGYYSDEATATFIIKKGTFTNNSAVKVALKSNYENLRKFTGSEVQPELVVKYNGITLTEGTHYSVTYQYCTNVSNESPTVALVKGEGSFEGITHLYYNLVAKNITESTVSIDIPEIDAAELEQSGYPNVTVTDTARDINTGEKATDALNAGYILQENVDYELKNVVINNDGTATVEVVGVGNYNGTATVDFIVNQTEIDDSGSSGKIKIESVLPDNQKSFVYTGQQVVLNPEVTMTTDGVTIPLEEGVDYTVVSDAVDVGTYSYQIAFMGKYAGTYQPTDKFTITARSIADSGVTVDEISNQAYTGSAITPAVTVRYNGAAIDSKNYSVAYSNNVASGTATVTITGKNNFTGTRTTTFQIRPSISDGNLVVTGLDQNFVYTSKEIQPKITVKSGNTTLTEGVDYTLAYENNINATEKTNKSAYVIVKGTGQYGGEERFPFSIKRKNIYNEPDVTITVEDAEFTGGLVKPTVQIIYDLGDEKYVLKDPDDYQASVGDGTDVGDEVQVTITPSGKNFYCESGSFKKSFKILAKSLVDENQNLKSDFMMKDIAPQQYQEDVTVYEPDVELYDTSREAETSGSAYYQLVRNIDYTLTYSNNTKPGTAYYTVTGIKNYQGTYTGKFVITADFEDATVEIDNPIYTGDPLTPDFTVRFGDMELRKDVDYTYEFSNNINAGEATLTIIGKGDYEGSQKVQKFTIQKKPIKADDVVMTHVYGSYTYTGENIYPEPHFTYNGTKLQKGTDFTCTYLEKCDEPGTWYYFDVEGIGNFTGTIRKNYKIGDNYTQDTVSVVLDRNEFEYTGEPIKPAFRVTLLSTNEDLKANIQYMFEYEDNVDVGTGYVNTWGNPDAIPVEYAGNVSVAFKITPKSISDADVTMDSVSDQTYTGEAIEPTPAVYWKGKELIAGEDFQYIYRNNTETGTATLTIQGIHNFVDSQTVEFEICKKDISEVGSGITVEDIPDQIYTGNALEPSPELLWGEKTLVAGVDYTLTYENNTELGEATLTIQGTGNYTGIIRKTFHIIKVPLEYMDIEYEKVWQYTGNPIEPQVKISYRDNEGNRIYLDNSEFSITYKNTIDSGKETGVIIISGNGNYEGTKRCLYTIEPRELSDATITMDKIPNQVIDQEGKAEPEPVLIFRPDSKTSYTMIKGADYEVSYSNNTTAGQNGKVTVTGLHNFTGTLTQEFYIGSDIKQYIDSVEFVNPGETYVYDGRAKTPEVTVNLNADGKDLVEGRDYEILYDGQKKDEITDDAYATKAGVHKVSVNGLNPYGGGIELTYKIEKRNIGKAVFNIEDQTYTGSEIHPFIVGTDEMANTRLGEDDSTATVTGDLSKGDMWINRNAFTTIYQGNCTDIGTATVILKATEKSNYTGNVTVQFNIVAKDLRDASISSSTVTKQNYTGSAIKPGVKLIDSKRNEKGQAFDSTVDGDYYTLVEGTDYDVTYTDNVYPGIVTMTITGKNHYTGTLAKQFEIVADLSKAVIAAIPVQPYNNGNPVTPTLKVTLGSRTLKENFDYVVTYKNNTERGTATATISPVAGSMFTGSKSVTFEISRELSAQTAKLKLINTSFMYTGSAITPAVGVIYGGNQTLTAGKDFTVSYQNNVNVGTATVKVTGTGAFTGTLTGTFTIIKKSIIRCTFNNVTAQKYTGKATKQNMVVKDGTKTLVQNRDYKVTYVNNTNPGTATMTITGLGNYGGIKTIRYVINVPDMTKVKAKASTTSVKLSWSKVKGADGYAIYNKDNKLIAKTKSTSYTHKKLKSMKTYTYKVRPYVVSDGATYYGGFYKTLKVVTTPSKPSIKVSAGTKQVKVSWKKVKGVSGYVVYRSTKKSSGYKKVKTIKKASTTSYTNKNLKSKKKYYYKVRAYKTVNGKKVYSSYSSVKSETTK